MSFNGVITFNTNRPLSPVTGEIYFDVVQSRNYIYTGLQWIEISSLPVSAVEDLQKTEEEKLCEQHPGLAELREELKKAQEKFDTFKALVNNYEEPK